MARWALLFVFFIMTTGCALWPSESHRDVTLVTIDELLAAQTLLLLQQHEQQAQQSLNTNDTEMRCEQEGRELRASHFDQQLQQIDSKLEHLLNSTLPFRLPECALPESIPAYDGRVVIGEAEWIYLPVLDRHFEARVDSGAATSSLSATQIERFERDGKRWVRFQLQHDDEAADGSLSVEAEVVRTAVIRQVSSDETMRRPVIRLVLHLGQSVQQEAEFTLTDRSQMSYPILLGRQFLRDVVLIDVGRKFIHNKYVPETVIDDLDATQP